MKWINHWITMYIEELNNISKWERCRQWYQVALEDIFWQT